MFHPEFSGSNGKKFFEKKTYFFVLDEAPGFVYSLLDGLVIVINKGIIDDPLSR